MSRKRITLLLILVLMFIPTTLFAITGEEIVRTIDKQTTFDTSYSTGSIQTTDRFGTKTSTFKAWSRGASDSLIEFTSIAERGQKILRTTGSLYLFYPDAEEVIRMQGAALRQSVLGSDLSYEDMTEEKNTLDDYDVTLLSDEAVNGHDCYVVMLKAKTKSVAYPQQKLWVDKQTYVVWKAEYSTAQGRLLKTMEALATREVSGRTLASQSKIEDKMKKNSSTTMTFDTLQVNVPVDEKIFTLENLTW